MGWKLQLYIDGKQKISSSGTPNLEEANYIPILEKWFDDVHKQKEKEQKQLEQQATDNVDVQPKIESQETSQVKTNLGEKLTKQLQQNLLSYLHKNLLIKK